MRPAQTFHVVSLEGDLVHSIRHVRESGLWMNGGFFVFRKEIFGHMRPGEELVVEPFQRLIAQSQLMAYRYDGFWACMDTFKEKQQLDDLYSAGTAPWEVWKKPEG